MSTPSDIASLVSLAASGSEGFVPVSEEQLPHKFLSLAPAHSAPWKSPTLEAVVDKTEAPVVAALTPEQEELAKTRRSSSLSSDGARKRFLKLAHVAGEGDWTEEALE